MAWQGMQRMQRVTQVFNKLWNHGLHRFTDDLITGDKHPGHEGATEQCERHKGGGWKGHGP